MTNAKLPPGFYRYPHNMPHEGTHVFKGTDVNNPIEEYVEYQEGMLHAGDIWFYHKKSSPYSPMHRPTTPPEKPKNNVLRLVPGSGQRQEPPPEVTDHNKWFRDQLVALLADPDVDFSSSVLVVGTQRRLVWTQGTMPAVSLLAWGQHSLLNIEAGLTGKSKKP